MTPGRCVTYMLQKCAFSHITAEEMQYRPCANRELTRFLPQSQRMPRPLNPQELAAQVIRSCPYVQCALFDAIAV